MTFDMLPINNIIPRALAGIVRGAPLSPGKVDFAWKAAVGPALERVTAVRLEGGTLLVDAKGPQWTREVARLSTIILKRMQALLGEDAIREVRVR